MTSALMTIKAKGVSRLGPEAKVTLMELSEQMPLRGQLS